MDIDNLVVLYDATHEIEQLKDDIMARSAKLKQMQNDDLINITKKVDEMISATYWLAAANTKMVEVYYILPPEKQRGMRQHFIITKDLLKGALKRFNIDLEDNINKLEMYIEANKNVVDEKYAKEIKNYIELLTKFGEVFTRFIAELTNNLDHASFVFN